MSAALVPSATKDSERGSMVVMPNPVQIFEYDSGTVKFIGAGHMVKIESESFAAAGERWTVSMFYMVEEDGTVHMNRGIRASIHGAGQIFRPASDYVRAGIIEELDSIVSGFLKSDEGDLFLRRSELAQIEARLKGARSKLRAAEREADTARSHVEELATEYARRAQELGIEV